MLTKMQVLGPRESMPDLPLGDGPASMDPIQVRGITGLGPVAAAVNVEQFGSRPGALFRGSSVGTRNIVITFGLNPNWVDKTIETLRDLLYAYFMTQNEIKLRFTSDNKPVTEISGYVESFEPNHFSKDPEIQISIICPLPDFIAIEPETVSGVVGTPQTIDYHGSVDTGLLLEVGGSVGVPSYTGILSLYRTALPKQDVLKMNAVTVDATRYFRMSSVRGKKYLQNISIPDGVITNLMNMATSELDWLELSPGENEILVFASTPGQTWTLVYFERFGGL